MPEGAVLLAEDETILRLFPVLRRAWGLPGEAIKIGITGCNAKRVLFGTINLRTGHRIVMPAPNMRQKHFQAFLLRLRRSYPGRQIWLLLDRASPHIAPKSQALARKLDIVLVWLPKQCSELNPMDHLWRALKANISANYQFPSIDKHLSTAYDWTRTLPSSKALGLAGILSNDFWLKAFLT
jgi:transposase